MRHPALLAALALVALTAAPALAHEGNPNFESVVTGVEGVEGLKAQVLNGDDRLELINTGPTTLLVEGYDGEPYARLAPGGAVEVNRRSSATYLNEERFGDVDVPETADPKAAPQWRAVGRSGRFEFHDHRIHWMAKGDPPKVTDKSRRQKVFDWSVPIRAEGDAGGAGAVRGTLWWRGQDDGGTPAGAFAAGGALVVASLLFVVVVRRRRRAAPSAGSASEPGAREEAW